MSQKRIMILGGNIVQMEAILEAKRLGYYVISADLHKENPGHKVSDEYCKIDIIDKDAVLKEAIRLNIDGIVPYCSDTLAPIAAYVAEKMNLPHNPYDSVNILTHKDLFRKFLREHGFSTPWSESFSDINNACEYLKRHIANSSAIMKPVDSAGSRGVFEIRNCDELRHHWNVSMGYSSCKRVIIEQFLTKKGPQLDGDIFLHEGKVIFSGLADQHHIKGDSHLVPVSLSYPSIHRKSILDKALTELQRLFSLLDMKTGPCNVELMIGSDDRIYIIDLGPRNGGCNIPFLEQSATGFNETEFTIKAAVGDVLPHNTTTNHSANKYIMYYRASSFKDGIYKGLWISTFLQHKMTKVTELVSYGEKIQLVNNGDDTAAIVFAEFQTKKEMLDTIKGMDQHLRVITE